MKVAVIGADGQLGTDLVEVFDNSIPLSSEDIDIRNPEQTDTLINIEPDVIINTAAYHDIDEAEGNPDAAFSTNSSGALNVARAASETDAICVFISTNAVFDGTKEAPYTETDCESPKNIYGISKLAGEKSTMHYATKSYVVRTSALFGKAGAKRKDGTNFVDTMVKLGMSESDIQVVDDDITNPTFTRDLAEAIVSLLKERPPYGVYHLVNRGHTSWCSFAREIFSEISIDVNVHPVSSEEYHGNDIRPLHTPLSIEKAESYGISLRTWKDALRSYLDARDYPDQ